MGRVLVDTSACAHHHGLDPVHNDRHFTMIADILTTTARGEDRS